MKRAFSQPVRLRVVVGNIAFVFVNVGTCDISDLSCIVSSRGAADDASASAAIGQNL